MILYFTGTGNSKYVADALGDFLEDQVVSLNAIMKEQQELSFTSDKPYVIVAPIYAWRYPHIVEELIQKASFAGSKMIYFVATMASQTGKSDKYCYKLAQEIGMECGGFQGVPMPNNFVLASKMADEATNDAILNKAIPQVREIAEAIQKGESIHKTDKTPVASLLSGTVNRMFSKYMCSAKDYAVSENCIGCGKCVSVCPVNNVVLQEGRPCFEKNCLNCYACLMNCPQQAINIPGKTEMHGRYICKEYNTH